jgi:hypothetical protein
MSIDYECRSFAFDFSALGRLGLSGCCDVLFVSLHRKVMLSDRSVA